MQGYNRAINTIQAVEVMKSKLTLWDASAMLLAVPVALPVLAILLSFFGESGDTFVHLAATRRRHRVDGWCAHRLVDCKIPFPG